MHCLNISEIDHYCTLTNCISSFTNCLFTHLHFADKGPHSESCGFPSNHVQMLQLDHKNGWALKNSCFWNVVKTLESPLDSKEIKPVNPKGNQHRIFTGRTVTEASILWPPDTETVHWKRLSCWERLRTREEGGSRGWDDWMASPNQWTWVWANSGR